MQKIKLWTLSTLEFNTKEFSKEQCHYRFTQVLLLFSVGFLATLTGPGWHFKCLFEWKRWESKTLWKWGYFKTIMYKYSAKTAKEIIFFICCRSQDVFWFCSRVYHQQNPIKLSYLFCTQHFLKAVKQQGVTLFPNILFQKGIKSKRLNTHHFITILL